MNNWIIIPDLHGRTFWRDAVRGNEDKNIVFLGDYLDPYPYERFTPDGAFHELEDIIKFKNAHKDNVILLLGNHDLGYLDGNICDCRKDQKGAERNRKILEDNIDLFDLIHIAETKQGPILFSHAGIRNKWLEMNNIDEFALNAMLHDDEQRKSLFEALSQVSYYRGGSAQVSSPVWADVYEYIDTGDFLPGYVHIFGHTQLTDGALRLSKGGKILGWCLDCAAAWQMDTPSKIKLFKA